MPMIQAYFWQYSEGVHVQHKWTRGETLQDSLLAQNPASLINLRKKKFKF